MITLTAIRGRDNLCREWSWVSPLLQSAMDKVRRKGTSTLMLLSQFISGKSTLYRCDGQAQGVVALCVVDGKDCRWMQFEYLAGKIDGDVAFMRALFNGLMPQFEQAARADNCTELRIYGRPAWSRLLTGFVLTDIDGAKVLRKVLNAQFN